MPTTHACAKINLYLRVDKRLPSGYHEITSVMLPVPELYDTVSVEPSADGQLHMHCSDSSLPTDHRNLCVRAATVFAESATLDAHWTIHLRKRIPVAAGLGGGSSDAAAVLGMLNALHNQPLTGEQLHALAAQIGADVPFFLNPRPSLATGIGDQLRPIPAAVPMGIILANPGFPISARWAYEHWRAAPARPAAPATETVLNSLEGGCLLSVAEGLHNDLEFCSFHKFPVLDIVREAMFESGCLAVHLSGSGPTLFGICAPKDLHTTRRQLAATTKASVQTVATLAHCATLAHPE
ncbi:MAG: 4-(cytidine 5'-diphospho)-2-C-methyl-D-erythritol kinase [Verrucomicrobiota bacterium]